MKKLEVINVSDMKIAGTFKYNVPAGVCSDECFDIADEEREGKVYTDGNRWYCVMPLYAAPSGWGDDGGIDTPFGVLVPEECVYEINM